MAADQPSRRTAGLIAALLAVLLAIVPAVRAEDVTSQPPMEADFVGPPEPPQEAPETPEETGKYKRSYIPIPEFIIDPNEGNTFGIMGVGLFTDQSDEIKYMLAPDIRYNKTKGVYPIFRLFGYPSDTRRYKIAAGKSTTKDEDYEGEFAERGLWDGRAFFLTDVIYERDSTERFFGFGNDSPEDGESNYTGQEFQAVGNPGVWVLPHVSLAYRMRIRRFAVQRGQVSGLCFIGDFDHADCGNNSMGHRQQVKNRGLEPGVYWAHAVSATFDTRDSIDMPTNGSYASLYSELADRALGSSTSFVKFGGEVRHFFPFKARKNPIFAVRALLDYNSGSADTPFWEMNSLGGRRTLRAYGSDRFIGFNRSLASAELRTRVYSRRLFGVKLDLELAPFVEAGRVFHHVTQSPVNDAHWAYGLGFRGLVKPQIVAFVDVGYGSEGSAIFTGVDYPF